jgi:CRISPR-associated protein Cas1
MVNEILYCERLFYLEWAQGEFDDNAFTVEGRSVHQRVDEPGKTRKKPTPDAREGEDERPYRSRSVWLSSDRLGVTAKIDVVDEESDGRAVPIEYKRGRAPEVPEGAYLPERAQVCVHVLLLREHGYACPEGVLYFAGNRQRVTIDITDELIATTLAAIARARELAASARIPPPLVDSPKCNGCSLVGICLPDEVHLLERLAKEDPANDTIEEDERPAEPECAIRPLAAASDEKQPLYVSDQGAYVRLDARCLIVKPREGDPVEVRLPNTSQVCLFGNVQVSTQTIRALLERGVPLVYFTYGGWFLGRTSGLDSKNVELRIAQHAAAADADVCLRLARGFIVSKILNCRTMLRRNCDAPDGTALFELKQFARKAEDAASIESLLGFEGTAARAYFGSFGGMLGQRSLASGAFDLDGRNRRPPRDPINALLSLAYSLLTKDFAITLGTVGLDPMLGFLHRPRFGRPALALDLMEEFRPLVADSVVVNAVNTGVVDETDFQFHGPSCALRANARRRFILAYERRMQQVVTHPVFGYRVSYRRVLELQARLLSRVLLGEIDALPAFRTR